MTFAIRVVLLACAPCVLNAQKVTPTVAAGIANPVGGFGEFRSAGPLIRVGVVFGRPTRVSQFRLDLESAWMSGQNRLP